MKAVILAGGKGTRLYPLTKVVSKQLIPVGNKPLIFYPISIAMVSGVKDIMLVSQQETIEQYKQLIGDGKELGINIVYKVQDSPDGLAHGLNLAKEWVGKDNFIFMLGDNVVHGHGLTKFIKTALESNEHTMFSWWVKNPTAFGVIEGEDYIDNIVEKPEKPNSPWASIGLYVFTPQIFDYYPKLEKSVRGEYELPPLVMKMIDDGVKVRHQKLGRGFAWFDTGTITNLVRANNYIISHEDATGKMIGCLEEISYNNGWISKDELTKLVGNNKSEYYEYLKGILNDKISK